jgi:hypothetical protein
LKLNRPYIKPFFLCLILLRTASAGALDFGLVLSQELKVSNEASGPGRGNGGDYGDGGGSVFFYTPAAGPWFSGPLGKSFSLYVSGSLDFGYTADFGGNSAWRSPAARPLLDRTELSWLVSPSLYFRLGRQRFEDPAGFVAAGLFDGLSAGFSAAGSRFSLGAWYTGLLHKGTADITMTGRDQDEYEKPFAFDGGYFASRRGMVSFAWEKSGLGSLSSLALGVLGQFDLNGDEDWLHSQYLSARYGLRLPADLELQAGAVLGTGESPEWGMFFAGGLEITWTLSGAPDDHLSFRGLYSSPYRNERLRSFIPVNSLAQGQVFSPALAGISVIRCAYTLRPRPAISLTGEASYFIRTDTVSFKDNREPENLKGEGYFLGGECYATALWMPLPDLALTFGGGAFFPRTGNAFTDNTEIRRKAALGLILSL